MNLGLLLRFLFTILSLGAFLYAYIAKQNEITELRMRIPMASKELDSVYQENTRLRFEIEKIENPTRLIELARQPEYRHLKHPLLKEVIEIRE